MKECLEQFQSILIWSFFLPVLSSFGMLWFILLYQKKKFQFDTEQKDAIMREQALLIENQNALNQERSRIASEMHDDLGAGLTLIKYLSDNIISRSNDDSITNDTIKIAGHSETLVKNMSEIIWALNSRFDDINGMVSYLRRYIVEYLDDNQIKHSINMDIANTTISLTGERRRNLFLIVKEILHNSVKYSKAKEIKIFILSQNGFQINIHEIAGIGFDPEEMKDTGNGLFNIEKRLKIIDGKIDYQKNEFEMVIKISLPLVNEKSLQNKVGIE